MFRNYIKLIVTGLIVACIVAIGSHRRNSDRDLPQKELLIYCGITMIEPVKLIANQFEKEHDCIVKIIKGGSGELYDCLLANRLGDFFLPGSETYIGKAKHEGLVTEARVVGCNRAVMVVRKGNPKKIGADLNAFLDSRFRTVLGDPEMGSIGRETRLLLAAAGIYAEASEKTLFLTPDSKDLNQALREDVADLTINWWASVVTPENLKALDIIPLGSNSGAHYKLEIALLSCAGEVSLARLFFEKATSDQSRTLFAEAGFSCGGRP